MFITQFRLYLLNPKVTKMLVSSARLSRRHFSPFLFSQVPTPHTFGSQFLVQNKLCSTTSTPDPIVPPPAPAGETSTRNKFSFTHANQSTTSVIQAITGNFIITLSKFAAYAFTGSSAMLSEAIHTY